MVGAATKKQERGVDTSRKVLDAALACFVERGFAQATVQELSARSGVSVGSLYHHFGSREGVLFALYKRCLEGMLGFITERVTREKTARAGVETLVRSYLEWVRDHQGEARLVYAAAHTEFVEAYREELRAHSVQKVAPLVAWLGPHIAAGRVVGLPASLLEVVLIGPAAEASRRILGAGGGAGAFDEAIEVLPAVVWRAVRGEKG